MLPLQFSAAAAVPARASFKSPILHGCDNLSTFPIGHPQRPLSFYRYSGTPTYTLEEASSIPFSDSKPIYQRPLFPPAPRFLYRPAPYRTSQSTFTNQRSFISKEPRPYPRPLTRPIIMQWALRKNPQKFYTRPTLRLVPPPPPLQFHWSDLSDLCSIDTSEPEATYFGTILAYSFTNITEYASYISFDFKQLRLYCQAMLESPQFILAPLIPRVVEILRYPNQNPNFPHPYISFNFTCGFDTALLEVFEFEIPPVRDPFFREWYEIHDYPRTRPPITSTPLLNHPVYETTSTTTTYTLDTTRNCPFPGCSRTSLCPTCTDFYRLPAEDIFVPHSQCRSRYCTFYSPCYECLVAFENPTSSPYYSNLPVVVQAHRSDDEPTSAVDTNQYLSALAGLTPPTPPPLHVPTTPLGLITPKALRTAEFMYSRSSKKLKILARPPHNSQKEFVKESLIHSVPRSHKRSHSPHSRSPRDNEKLLANSGVQGYIAAKHSVKRNQSTSDSTRHFLDSAHAAASLPVPEQRAAYEKIFHQYEDLDLDGDLWLVREAINFCLTPEQVGLTESTFTRLCKLLHKISNKEVHTQGFIEDALAWIKTQMTNFRDSLKSTYSSVTSGLAKFVNLITDKATDALESAFVSKVKDFWEENGPFIKLTILIPLAAFLIFYSKGDPVHTISYTMLFSFLLGPEVIAILSKLRAQPSTASDLPLDDLSKHAQYFRSPSTPDSHTVNIKYPNPFLDIPDAAESDSDSYESTEEKDMGPLPSPPQPSILLPPKKSTPPPTSPDIRTVETQGSTIVDSFVTVISSFIGVEVDTRDAGHMLGDAVKMLSISNGVLNFLTKFASLVRDTICWILSKITGIALSIPVLADLMNSDSDFKIANEICARGVSTENYDVEFAQTAIQWHSKLIERAGNAARTGNHRLKSHFDTLYSQTYQFVEAFKTASLGNKGRIEPVVIMFLGKSGVGKSTLANCIMSSVFPKVFGKKYHPEDCYTLSVNPEYPYKDGYIAQKVVLMEERFADVAPTAITATLHTVLHLVSGNAMPADQAAIPLKGHIFMIPKFVIACENNIDVSVATISNKDAIPRRFKIVVKVHPGPHGVILPTDTPEQLLTKIHEYSFEKVKMFLQDKATNFTMIETGKMSSFEQLSELIAMTYRENHGMFEKLTNLYDTIGTNAMAEIQNPQLQPLAPVFRDVLAQGRSENLMALENLGAGVGRRYERFFKENKLDFGVDAVPGHNATAKATIYNIGKNITPKLDELECLMGSLIHSREIRLFFDEHLCHIPYTPAEEKGRFRALKDLAISAMDVIRSSMSAIADFIYQISPYLIYFFTAAATFTALILLGKAIEYMFPTTITLIGETSDQGYAARAPERHHPGLDVRGPVGRQGSPTTVRTIVSQAGFSAQSLSVAESKIFPNQVSVTAVFTDPAFGDLSVTTDGLFVDDITLAVPGHLVNATFSPKYRSTSYLRIKSGFGNSPDFILHCNEAVISFHQPNKEIDLVVLRLAIPYPHMHNVDKHFMPAKQLARVDLTDAVLICRSNEGIMKMLHLTHITRDTATARLPYSSQVVDSVNAYRYTAPTRAGDCGAVMCHTDPRCEGLIIGMHIAGDNLQTGFSVPITREDAQSWRRLPRPRDAMPETGDTLDLPYVPLTREEHLVMPQALLGLTVLGKTKPGHVVYCPTQTSIQKSLIASSFKTDMAPANLAAFTTPEGERKLPSWFAMDYAKAKTYFFSASPHMTSGHPILHEMFTHSFNEQPVWSYDMALNGNDMVPAIDVSTSKGDYRQSEGFPKSHYLPRDPIHERLSMHPTLLADVEHILSLLADVDGDYITLTTGLPKDETLRLVKVLAMRTRLVYPECLPLLIIDRILFGPLVSHMKRLRFRAPAIIGVAPADWWRLELLYRNCPPIGSDIVKNDLGAQGNDMFGAFKFILDFFSHFDPSPVRRRMRFKRLLRMHYLLTDYFGYTIAIMILMSGAFMTSCLNSIRQLNHKASGFVYFCPPEIKPTFVNMSYYWRLVVYSDDGFQAKDLIFCTQEQLVSFIKAVFGMDYELDKDGTIHGPCILKRSIFVYNGIVLAPLVEESILGMLCWVSKAVPRDVATRLNCESALREYAHYGEERFNTALIDINAALVKVGLVPISMSWHLIVRDSIPSNARPQTASSRNDVKLPTPLPVRDVTPQGVVYSCQGHCSHSALMPNPSYPVVLSDGWTKNWISELLTPTTPIVTDSSAIITHESTVPVVAVVEPTIDHDLNKLNPYPPSSLETILTEREYQLAQASWATGTTVNTDIISLAVPDIFFTFAQVRERTRGWQLLRTDAEVRVEVAMPPALYGMLLVSHLPATDVANTYRSTSLRQKSWANPVTIDGSSPSSPLIHMAYQAERPWQSIPSIGTVERGVTGHLKVTVLHQLKAVSAAAPSAVTVTVFGRLKNVHLSGYDPTVVAPEPEAIFAALKKAIRINSVVQGRNRVTPPHPQVDEAEKQASTGILSGISETVGNVAPLLTPLPVVGPIAAAVGGIANLLTPVFRIFGLEKPDALVTPQLVIKDVGYEFPHVSGTNTGVKMTARRDAYLTTPKGIIGIGECNPDLIDFCRIPGLYLTSSFTSAAAADSLLLNMPVLSNDIQPYQNGSMECHDPIPIDIPSKMYAYWRGSIKYLIKFCTSKFVACKVRVVLCQAAVAPANIAVYAGDIPGKVIDINGSVDVPIMVGFNFNDVVAETGTWSALQADWQNTATANNCPAQLAIYLVSAVTSTDTTVTPTVYVSVWKAAGEDYQLFHPIGKKSVPVWSAVNPTVSDPAIVPFEPILDFKSALFTGDKKKTNSVTQSIIRQVFKSEFPTLLPTTRVVEEGLVSSEECTGIADLMHRWQFFSTGTASSSAHVSGTPTWLAGRWRQVAGTNIQTWQAQDYLAACFLGYRGGMRWCSAAVTEEKYAIKAVSPYGDTYLNGWAFGPSRPITFPYAGRLLYEPILPTIAWLGLGATGFGAAGTAQLPGRMQFNFSAEQNVSTSFWIFSATADDGVLATVLPPPLIKATQV
jgi:hypothetical protein